MNIRQTGLFPPYRSCGTSRHLVAIGRRMSRAVGLGGGWGTVAGAAATPTAPKSPLRNWTDGRVQRYEGGLAGTANGGMAWGQTRGI